MKKEKVHFILTGGTIDSYYDTVKDTVLPLEKSIIPDYMIGLKSNYDFKFSEVCMKDSRELNRNDLAKILKTVKTSKIKKIIITHGTYSMPDTARFLESALGEKNDKVILLTGSMLPLRGFAPSDASFNLGFALGNLFSLSPGVCIAMNGSVLPASGVMKFLSEGRFVSVFNK